MKLFRVAFLYWSYLKHPKPYFLLTAIAVSSLLTDWTKEEAVVILASSRDTLVSESFKYIRIMKQFKQGDNVIPNLHLLERAIEHYELPTKEQRDPDSSHYVMVFRPIDFIKWAKKKEIVLPDGLEELVSKYYVAEDEDLRAKCQTQEEVIKELQKKIKGKGTRRDKADISPNKMILGKVKGGALVITPAISTLVVGEEIGTALNVYATTGFFTWANFSP